MGKSQHFVIALVFVSVILGGGGGEHAFREMLLELIAMIACVLWARARFSDGEGWPPLGATMIIVAVCALPLLQLIPLPPGIWHALPGREIEKQALSLVGLGDSWRPLSVKPSATIASVLSLGPPCVVIAMVSALRVHQVKYALAAAVAASFLGVVFGVIAAKSGGSVVPLVFSDSTGVIHGFQANRNTQADLLLLMIPAYALVLREWIESKRNPLPDHYAIGLAVVGAAILAGGVLLTRSRMGVALLPVPLIAAALITVKRSWLTSVRLTGMALGALLLAGGAFLMLRNNAAVVGLISRMDFSHELRPAIWRDSLIAMRQYWPVGSGFGTFTSVFPAVEGLDVVNPLYSARSHNDFIELSIESGIAGSILLTGVVLFVLYRIVRRLMHPASGVKRQSVFALSAVTVIGLHSLVDYPLRSMSLLCLAAVTIALLMIPLKTNAPRKHARTI